MPDSQAEFTILDLRFTIYGRTVGEAESKSATTLERDAPISAIDSCRQFRHSQRGHSASTKKIQRGPNAANSRNAAVSAGRTNDVPRLTVAQRVRRAGRRI